LIDPLQHVRSDDWNILKLEMKDRSRHILGTQDSETIGLFHIACELRQEFVGGDATEHNRLAPTLS
jgi:hypothetical protein